MTLSARLKQVFDSNPSLSKTGLWKACNLSSGAISQWFSGQTKELKGDNLLKAASYLGVNPDWLSSGKGHMLPTVEKREPSSFVVAGIKIEKTEVHLVRMYKKLSLSSQTTIDLLVNRLYELEHPGDKIANPSQAKKHTS